MTFEDILERMLNKVPSDVDKREGSIIYDALAPAAAELAQMYIQLAYFNSITYVDEATGDYLTKRCAERGVMRKQATKAVRKGIFNLDIPIGSRFTLLDTTYITVEKIKDFEYKLECEQLGVIGNTYSGDLTAITNIQGLVTARLKDILIPGENTEDDESLRKRYFDNLESEAYGGNVADYKQKTKSINGVGGVKVYPTWNGGGTVKLVILDSEFNKPSEDLVSEVQELIDPVQNQGKGVGIAPIGHLVTIQGVKETIANIESDITLVSGYSWEDVKPHIESTIRAYFKELSSTWDTSENLVVRIAYIEARILQITGVLDVQQTKVNGAYTNLILDADNIPKLETVSRI